jgi:hypothetical protein
MPRRRSSYFLAKTNQHIQGSKVKKLPQDDQIDLMRHWFYDRYASPDDLPYDSGEGGYQWIWGGPYDANDALENEFSGIASDDAIEALVSDLEDISHEWSGKPSADDFDDDYLADLIDSGTDPFMTLIGSMTEIESAAKIRTSDKKQKTLHKLLFANVITALETFLSDSFMKTLSQSDQYVEDFVRKTGRFQNTTIKLSEIFDRFKKIDAEVRTFVLGHNWHMMEESAMMYKRAFNIKFPDLPETIKKGISDRHDIVHRNGKTKDGAEGSWDLVGILALKEAVLTFAGAIDSEVKKLPRASVPIPPVPEAPDESIEI